MARAAAYGTPAVLLNASADVDELEGPLSVPVEGVKAWELHGGPGDYLQVKPEHVLQPAHTIAAWFRLDARGHGFSALLADGNDFALVLSPELRLGVVAVNGAASRFVEEQDSVVLPRNEWLLLVSVGESRGFAGGGHFGKTRFYVGRSCDGALVEAGSVELCAAGLAVSRVSTPTSALGSLAELAVWERAVPLDELQLLFAARRAEFGCAAPPAPPPPPPLCFTPAAGGLCGEAVDAASCAALSGVAVRLGGVVLATTDECGRFALPSVPDGARGAVEFVKEGFAPALHAPSAVMHARLLRADASRRFAARDGGSLHLASGASLTVAPGSLCTVDGVPYDGEASVALAILDAASASAVKAMPGDFSALGHAGEACQLETFGAAWVGLTDAAGNELRVRDGGAPLELSMATTAPMNYEKLGVAPSLWAFDGAASKWVQAPSDAAQLAVDGVELPAEGGAATAAVAVAARPAGKKGKGPPRKWNDARDAWTPERFAKVLAQNGGAKQLRLRVRRAGWWNVDAPYVGSLLSLRVLTPAGEPVGAAMIYAVGVDYKGSSAGKTDANGRVSILAQFASRIQLNVQLADAQGAHGLSVEEDDWLHPTPPVLLPQVVLGQFGTGAMAGASVELGDLKLTRAAAAA